MPKGKGSLCPAITMLHSQFWRRRLCVTYPCSAVASARFNVHEPWSYYTIDQGRCRHTGREVVGRMLLDMSSPAGRTFAADRGRLPALLLARPMPGGWPWNSFSSPSAAGACACTKQQNVPGKSRVSGERTESKPGAWADRACAHCSDCLSDAVSSHMGYQYPVDA
jgi:hypothetical protein